MPGVYRKGLLSKNWEIFKKDNWFRVYSTVHNTSYKIKAPPDFLGFTELNDSVFFLNTMNGTFYLWLQICQSDKIFSAVSTRFLRFCWMRKEASGLPHWMKVYLNWQTWK